MAIGSYAVERDYSHYVAYAAKTIFAVVGTATKGPIGVATVCTSAQDLVNKFGPLNPKCLGLYAGQYFLSQSSKLYFVRAASRAVAGAKATITGDGKSVLDSVTFEFLDKGTYYNGYELYVSRKTVTTTPDTSKGITTITTIINGPVPNDDPEPVVVTRNYISGQDDDVDPKITYSIRIRNGSGVVVDSVEVTLDELLKGRTSAEGIFIDNYKTEYLQVVDFNTATTVLDPGIYPFAGGRDGISDENVVVPKLTSNGKIEVTNSGTEDKPVYEVVTETMTKLEIAASDYSTAAKALESSEVDMNLFAVPGVSEADVITDMLTLAENRGDCLYLVDPPQGLTRDGVAAWHNATGDYSTEDRTVFNSSYGALYYDWVTIYDSVNKVKLEVPPSVVVAASIAYSDRISEPWYAPAGLTRGVIRGVLGTVTKLGKNDVSYLYEGSNNINSIYDDTQVGPVIWGQKTLLRSDTALNRVNVRRLLNYLKKIVTAACDYLTFDPNDRVTWNSFEMKVIPVLESIKNRRGIYEYRVIKGETIVTSEDIDNYKMPCMIMIRPTKAAEEIPIYFVITSTGADFNEVLESNGIVTI